MEADLRTARSRKVVPDRVLRLYEPAMVESKALLSAQVCASWIVLNASYCHTAALCCSPELCKRGAGLQSIFRTISYRFVAPSRI